MDTGLTRMGLKEVMYRKRLLERWGWACIVCGRDFANLACVTKEHIIPKSAMVELEIEGNLAPSHFTCNQLRHTGSIIAAGKVVESRAATMDHERFLAWLNKPVPGRSVPIEALLPFRQLRFMELPDHVPGMSHAALEGAR